MGERSFVPAAGHDWLLPLYDPLQRLLGAESARRELLVGADIRPGHRVLDLGCGTGDLSLLVARSVPEAEVVGIDPDPKALALARRKAERAGLEVRFEEGFGDALPFPDGSFDRAVSSFVFHHLSVADKRAALAETRRVLVGGGSLTLLDFGGDAERRDGLLARLLHHEHQLEDNYGGRLAALIDEAGFVGARTLSARRMLLGQVSCYGGAAP